MARGVRRLTGATYGVSTTGVAGPDEQGGQARRHRLRRRRRPDGDSAIALELVGDRATIQDRTCEEALTALGCAPTSCPGKNQASVALGTPNDETGG
jgi:nicotinamide mononucleotide (NMN) deamidase PncC